MSTSEQIFGVQSKRHLTPAEWAEHIIVNGVHAKKTIDLDADGNVVNGVYTSKVDDLGNTIYIGKANTGTSASSSGWQIKKITISGSVTTTEWADGDSNFDNIWDNRVSISYS